MSVAPAEPLSDAATELAFELDVIGTVFLAILDACTYTNCGALRADEFLGFVLPLAFLLSTDAIFQTSEIGAFTFVTLVVSKFEQGECLKVLVVRISLQLQPWVFIDAFELTPFQ